MIYYEDLNVLSAIDKKLIFVAGPYKTDAGRKWKLIAKYSAHGYWDVVVCDKEDELKKWCNEHNVKLNKNIGKDADIANELPSVGFNSRRSEIEDSLKSAKWNILGGFQCWCKYEGKNMTPKEQYDELEKRIEKYVKLRIELHDLNASFNEINKEKSV